MGSLILTILFALFLFHLSVAQVVDVPTQEPTELQLSQEPSQAPTYRPSKTGYPSFIPSIEPTQAPTDAPTDAPSDTPTSVPTKPPTYSSTHLTVGAIAGLVLVGVVLIAGCMFGYRHWLNSNSRQGYSPANNGMYQTDDYTQI